MNSIASRLKAARSERGLSQSELAKAAGVSQSTIGNIEASSRQGSALALHKLSVALKVRFEWLLEGEDPRDATAVQLSPEVAEYAKLIDEIIRNDPDERRRWFARYMLTHAVATPPRKSAEILEMARVLSEELLPS